MKTNEQIMVELQGTIHPKVTIVRADISQLDPTVIIVLLSDGTQRNVSAIV